MAILNTRIGEIAIQRLEMHIVVNCTHAKKLNYE